MHTSGVVALEGRCFRDLLTKCWAPVLEGRVMELIDQIIVPCCLLGWSSSLDLS